MKHLRPGVTGVTYWWRGRRQGHRSKESDLWRAHPRLRTKAGSPFVTGGARDDSKNNEHNYLEMIHSGDGAQIGIDFRQMLP